MAVLGSLDSGLDGGFPMRAVLAPLRVSVALLPYASLSFLVALWSRTTAAGIVVVVVAFYAEVLLMPLLQAGGAFSAFPEHALIYQNIRAILNASAVDGDADLPGTWQAVAVLLAYTSVFVSVAVWRFRSRDITGP